MAKPTSSGFTQPTATPPSMPAGESSSISDSQQSIQMHGSQNKIEGFIKDLEELHKFVRESRAKGRDEAVERADKLIKDMRNYATAQVDTSRLLTNIGQEIQTKITQQIQHQFQALQTNLKDNKTWAQVAATPPSQPENRSVSMEKRKEVERTCKQRAEYEVTLTAAASPTEVKDAIKTHHPRDITETLQRAIDEAKLQGNPRQHSINKLGAYNIRLIFKTKEIAKTVRDAGIDWNHAFLGLSPHKPKYGIVIHGVPNEAIDFDNEYDNTIQEWEAQNSEKGIKITRVTMLHRQEKHKPTPHKSLIVFTEDKEAANKCIKLRFLIDGMRLKVEKYVPHLYINQCFRCHGFGHRAMQCKKKERCGKCSDDKHTTMECHASEMKCTNCKGNHAAWIAECPVKTEESSRLTQMRREASIYFA